MECEGCEGRCPDLMPENDLALELVLASQTQLRTTMGGVIGLDYNAVWRVADVLGVEMTPEILRKLRAVESQLMREKGGA